MVKRLERDLIYVALKAVLRPLARFCLRHALKLQDVVDTLKLVLVEEAKDELGQQEQKLNVSRLSIITGVHRRDVHTLMHSEPTLPAARDLATKIMGRWQTDSNFLTKANSPKLLSFGFDGCEFNQLVKQVSSDLNPASILYELERSGSAIRVKNKLKLVKESFVPKGDVAVGFQILSHDIEDLTQAVETNLISDVAITNFHARTSYDGIREDAVPLLKRWFLKHGHAFHAKARTILSKYDQDVNPRPNYKGKRVRVVLGSFANTNNNKDLANEKDS